MEATKTRATISAKHLTNIAATQYTIRASRKIISSIWSPCEVWNNSHSDEYQITVNVAPGYTLNSYAPTFEAAVAEFDRLTDGKYNIDTKEMPATPTETPQISTEAAETVNVSAEGEKGAETRENTPKRKIQYFHYTPEQLKRYIIDVYEKRANGEWVLLPYAQIDTDKCFWNVINGKIGEWDRMQERFTEVNMDFNSPTCGRCFKINRTYQQDYFIVSNEKLLEFTINGNYYYIQKQTYSKGKHKWCYTIMDAYGDFAVDDFSYTKRGIMQRFNKWWKKNATIIWQASETPTEPPQSPEAPHKA